MEKVNSMGLDLLDFEDLDQEFDFIGCDDFNPDLTTSSASVMWYKAGQTIVALE